VYGRDGTRSIVGTASQQVWHRPQDDESAAQRSTLFGEVTAITRNATAGSSASSG
jgi:type IV secretory pathway TraG/TraD family ATPase VirD4